MYRKALFRNRNQTTNAHAFHLRWGPLTLIPKIVAQTLQRFSSGWLSPDLEAGVSESPSGQKFGEQIHKQLQPSQRGATRHLAHLGF